MADIIYNNFFEQLAQANIDFDTDSIKVALCTSAYTPDKDHENFDSASGSEASGTGYTAGGQTLANASITQDDTNDRVVLDGDDVIWSNSSITARYAVIYKDTGTQSTSPLIACIDFTEDKTSVDADFKIQWNTNGIIRFSQV